MRQTGGRCVRVQQIEQKAAVLLALSKKRSPAYELIEVAASQQLQICVAAYARDISESAVQDRLETGQGRLSLPQPRIAACHIIQALPAPLPPMGS